MISNLLAKAQSMIMTFSEFKALNLAILTISDTRSLADDKSGNVLVDLATADGHRIADRQITRDDKAAIIRHLQGWIANPDIDAVISTGGTGLTGRDITPEAFEPLYDKPIPGFGELFRMLSYQKIGVSTIQSRATAGIANGTFLFALPGSPSACKDAWEMILKHQLDARSRPCNFVELMPRLKEV